MNTHNESLTISFSTRCCRWMGWEGESLRHNWWYWKRQGDLICVLLKKHREPVPGYSLLLNKPCCSYPFISHFFGIEVLKTENKPWQFMRKTLSLMRLVSKLIGDWRQLWIWMDWMNWMVPNYSFFNYRIYTWKEITLVYYLRISFWSYHVWGGWIWGIMSC